MDRNLGGCSQCQRFANVILDSWNKVQPFTARIGDRARGALVSLRLSIKQLGVEAPGRLRLIAGAKARRRLMAELVVSIIVIVVCVGRICV